MRNLANTLSGKPSSIDGADADEVYFPGPKVAARYNVSDMTIWRWLRDERMQFPPPHYFGRFRYWRLSQLVSWERQRLSRVKS